MNFDPPSPSLRRGKQLLHRADRIFHSPSEKRPKGSYFSGSSWVSPAPSLDPTNRPNLHPRIVIGLRWNSFALKGLLGFPPSGYEISGLKRRNVYKVAVAIPTMHPFAKQIVASLALKEWSRHSWRVI